MLRIIGKKRFDAMAGWARGLGVTRFATEVEWFANVDETVLACLLFDVDHEFSCVVFAEDAAGRFRWIAQTEFRDLMKLAVSDLEEAVESIESSLETSRIQGDEGRLVDFFSAVVKDSRFHERFRMLNSGQGFSAGRAVVSLLMRWVKNQDGNFVEQFQTTGFDSRIWEIYLFAAFRSIGLEVHYPDPAPDFMIVGIEGKFFVEATTINPSVVDGTVAASSKPSIDEDPTRYLEDYLPIRFAGPLTAKLAKEYWTDTEVGAMPLVFAIQDFHDELSMTYSVGALTTYLYGRIDREVDEEGSIVVKSELIAEHTWNAKTIPSNYFELPDAEHVSAVIFNPVGTLAKFNRMGVGAGFGVESVTLQHIGVRIGLGEELHRLNFSEEVGQHYEESWEDGMNVFHNPNALHPLNPDLLPGVAHHFLKDDRVVSFFPENHLFGSRTLVINRIDSTDGH